MAIEDELMEVINLKGKEYTTRQDYLAAVGRKADALTDEDFGGLSVEATLWCNAAITALRRRKKLPDFDAEIVQSGDNYSWEEPETKAENPVGEAAPVVEAEAAEEQRDTPKRRPKGQPPKILEHTAIDPQLGIENFDVDKFGLVVGSKNAAAASMFEKGCRMADVTASIGGTYYNLLNRLQKYGHTVNRTANGGITLICKE